MAQQARDADERENSGNEGASEGKIREVVNMLLGSSELATLEVRNGEIIEIKDNFHPDNDSPDIMARVAFPEYPPIDARGDVIDEGEATFYRSRPIQGGDGYKMLIDVRYEGKLYGLQVNLGVPPAEV